MVIVNCIYCIDGSGKRRKTTRAGGGWRVSWPLRLTANQLNNIYNVYEALKMASVPTIQGPQILKIFSLGANPGGAPPKLYSNVVPPGLIIYLIAPSSGNMIAPPFSALGNCWRHTWTSRSSNQLSSRRNRERETVSIVCLVLSPYFELQGIRDLFLSIFY